MGCHLLDLPFWALDLKYPTTVETVGPPVHPEMYPRWLIARWTFPARNDLPPVELTWYDGGKKPPMWEEGTFPNWSEGVLFVGAEGMLILPFWQIRTASAAEVCRLRTAPTDDSRIDRPRSRNGLRRARRAAQPVLTSATQGL